MADFDALFKEIEQQIITLAEGTVSNFRDEAIKDANELVEAIKGDLIRWTKLLEQGEIKINEFEWLVNSDKELAKMKALEKAGLAATRIEQFAMSVLNLIVDKALKLAVGNAIPLPVP